MKFKNTENIGHLFDNESSKERLLAKDNIDGLSKALTHYLFRNGPVEDMHSDGKLSEDDMKTLNQYMVNRLSGLLHKIFDEQWSQLEFVYSFMKLYGAKWNKPTPDTKEIDYVWEQFLLGNKKN